MNLKLKAEFLSLALEVLGLSEIVDTLAKFYLDDQ